ncbi:hypothetical protein [Bradyrhizobium erythrophlei]|uniref:hypothetical protein n=1 Tax=Bradyrhizobium erythrophlei TaxID=1437360 RepID=UPI0009A7FFF3|nr:hypothetical protein [Bradyrhizobium erythrophlei]
MKVEIIVAVIAATASLAAVVGTYIGSRQSSDNARAIAVLQIDNQKLQDASQREKEMSKLREPLARAAFDLQSRIYNILKQDLIRRLSRPWR